MDELVQDYIDYIKKVRSGRTHNTYKVSLNRFKTFCKGHKLQVDTLRPTALEDFSHWLIEQKYVPASIQTFISAVKGFLEWCARRGVLIDPNIYRPKLPSVHATEEHSVLTGEQLLEVLELIKDELKLRDRTVVALLATTGLRANELRQLRVDDFSKEDNTILVHVHSLGYNSENMGKGGKARVVPMLDQGKPFLINYLKNRKEQKSPWLFPSPYDHNRPIVGRQIFDIVKKIAEISNFDIQPHTFRRTYATLLTDNGVDPLILARIMGHSNMTTTLRYVRPESKVLAAHVGKLNIEEKYGRRGSGRWYELRKQREQRKEDGQTNEGVPNDESE